jgi:hypothetical protein
VWFSRDAENHNQGAASISGNEVPHKGNEPFGRMMGMSCRFWSRMGQIDVFEK